MLKTRFAVLFLLLSLLSGCSLLPDQEDETKGWSANKFYAEASDALASGDYETAIKYYELLEARYPFGRYAMQAQLDVAYAYYKYDEHESALAAADRFIRLHPNSPAAAYAYYLKGLVNFNRRLSLLTRFIPTDTSQRDPAAAQDAYDDFGEVVRQFPNSPYARDAAARMRYLRNNLAMHQIHVAQYYMDRGAYLAAANRAIRVVEDYQRTPAVKDALEIMVAAYDKLGMDSLKQDAERVYAMNLEKGNFAPDQLELEEKNWGRQFWDYLELDKN